jgi:hypothetical protein
MKLLLLLSFALPLLISAEPLRQVLVPVESRPKVIEGIEFSIVTQAEWPIPVNSYNSQPIILQLRITNRTDHAILFPTFDSFNMGIEKFDGVRMLLHGERDETQVTPNLLLQPGSSFSMTIEAALTVKDKKSKSLDLIVKDGTGSVASATLLAGSYSAFFEVHPTHYDFEKKAKLPAPLWSGKGVTESIDFTLSAP